MSSSLIRAASSMAATSGIMATVSSKMMLLVLIRYYNSPPRESKIRNSYSSVVNDFIQLIIASCGQTDLYLSLSTFSVVSSEQVTKNFPFLENFTVLTL